MRKKLEKKSDAAQAASAEQHTLTLNFKAPDRGRDRMERVAYSL
jgi:hypothetical protein